MRKENDTKPCKRHPVGVFYSDFLCCCPLAFFLSLSLSLSLSIFLSLFASLVLMVEGFQPSGMEDGICNKRDGSGRTLERFIN